MVPWGMEPWYRRARRWGQTNLTEIDPQTYDPEFWRAHWRRTGVQGVIVNAGGIVAYYPTGIDLHYRAELLGNRDLFGDIVGHARAAGLTVLARMDCNRALPAFREAHPDWFVTRKDGSPVEVQGRYVACVSSPYYKEHIPRILAEIIRRYRPDGFTDNSWTGAGSSTICRCPHCRSGFHDEIGHDLPAGVDWDDPIYRRWVTWSYAARLANWELFNEVCRREGGPDCLWLGMVNANPFGSHLNFADLHEIGRRSRIMMCDHQSRDALNGFEQNAVNGALLHAVGSADTLIPESMAHYVRGPQAFRRASMPAEEVRTWMRSGFAGGIAPWWHHVGATQEDRRQFETSEELFAWHAENDEWLHDRESLAEVALIWSHENNDFYGRDDRRDRCALPWRGMTAALTRARVPFVPLHAESIPRTPQRLRCIVLPDVAVLSDRQCATVIQYLHNGGGVVLTGATGALGADGEPRSTWPFAAVTGLAPSGRREGVGQGASESWEVPTGHTYLRITEAAGSERTGGPFADLVRRAFAGTAILPFGGTIHEYTRTAAGSTAEPVATYVPPFPIYPPEFAWMRRTDSDITAIHALQLPSGARVVVCGADIDRQYGRLRLPDHGDLLRCAVEWTGGPPPVMVSGPGYLSCHVYRSRRGVVVHAVNLTGLNEWPGYAEEVNAVGPVRIGLRRELIQGESARSLVTGSRTALEPDGEYLWAEASEIRGHEVFVFPAGR